MKRRGRGSFSGRPLPQKVPKVGNLEILKRKFVIYCLIFVQLCGLCVLLVRIVCSDCLHKILKPCAPTSTPETLKRPSIGRRSAPEIPTYRFLLVCFWGFPGSCYAVYLEENHSPKPLTKSPKGNYFTCEPRLCITSTRRPKVLTICSVSLLTNQM